MTTTAPIVFLDTETDGLHPGRQAWEIAMIRRDQDGERELVLVVDSVDLSTADPMALKINGFYDRHPAYNVHLPDTAVTEGRAAVLVEEWTRGAVVVGANPQFDTVTLEPLLRRHGLLPAWHYRPVCIEAIAYGYLLAKHLAHPTLPTRIPVPWKSDQLSDLLGVPPIDPAERHTALGDARWVAAMWDRIHPAALR